MVSSSFVKLFHLLALGTFSFALYYNYKFISPLETKVRGFQFGGPLVYLTILTSVVQVAYYGIAFVCDFMPSVGLRKLRDYVYGTFALPLALETSLMFWTMTSIDRELVFPKALDEFFPRWLDFILHTNVSIFILLDLLMVHHIYPKKRTAIRGLTLFMLSYLIWIYLIFINTGRWVYGIIGIFTAPQRIAFFLVCGLVTIFLYLIGETLSKFVVRSEMKNKTK